MPQTRPNGIETLIGSDPYNLPQNLADMADSINHVIPVNTQAERDALPAYDGMIVVRLDRGALTQTYTDGAWRSNYVGPYRSWIAIAENNIPGAAAHNVTINFPSGLFTLPPTVGLTLQGSTGVGFTLYAYDVTASSFKIGYYWAGNTTAYTGVRVRIEAEQVSPTSAVGSNS